MSRELVKKVEWLVALDHRNEELMSLVNVNTWNEDGKIVTHVTLDTEYTSIWVVANEEQVMVVDMDVTKVTTSEQNRSVGNFLNLAYARHFTNKL